MCFVLVDSLTIHYLLHLEKKKKPNRKETKSSKEQALDLQGLETFGRHLLHDDEYPPDRVTTTNPLTTTTATTTTKQTQHPSTVSPTISTGIVHGESQQEALEHFASHLIHNSEARLELDESTKKH